MPKYNLYAGLGGDFGGANYITTEEFTSEEEARQEAYRLAVEEYESYEGLHGILDWDDCREAMMEDNNYEEPDPSEVNDYYLEEIESWIEYYITPYDPNNPPEG